MKLKVLKYLKNCRHHATLIIKVEKNTELVKGRFKYYVIKEVGGWGQKMATFDDLQYRKSSKRWVGLKSQKHDDVILEWSLPYLHSDKIIFGTNISIPNGDFHLIICIFLPIQIKSFSPLWVESTRYHFGFLPFFA
jgi:hypothetical protein